MPIYEYQCDNCEHKMEAIHKISDAPLKQCPECKQDTLRKLMSAAAFKLTGTGWYETDFKDKPKTEEKGKSDDGKKDKTDKAETTKESKPKESANASETKVDKPKKKETVTKSTD